MNKEKKEIIAFKGFDKDFKCRDYQYEVGETYTYEGVVEVCASGFHSCEYPLDVFNYYAPSDSIFASVIASGSIKTHDADSKIASASIKVVAELKIPELVSSAIKWITERTTEGKAASNTGDYSAASNTGDRSAASNTGDYSAASNTGDRSAASNTGDRSAASNIGDRSAASNTGDRSAASNIGDRSAASNTGDYSAASNTGDQSAASNTGDRSAASNTGYQSAASNTGDRSAASNTGDYSAASNTGYRSAASVSGKSSIAIASGKKSKAKASKGGAIVLCAYDEEGNMTYVRSAIAGNGEINPDTWYQINDAGEFVETE